MFEKLFNRKISIKNLYIIALIPCVDVDYRWGFETESQFGEPRLITLARIIEKDYKKYYQDIFTKTLYDDYHSVYKVGDIGARQIRPVVLTKPYITYKEDLLAYNTLNNISQNSVKSLQKRKKH